MFHTARQKTFQAKNKVKLVTTNPKKINMRDEKVGRKNRAFVDTQEEPENFSKLFSQTVEEELTPQWTGKGNQ